MKISALGILCLLVCSFCYSEESENVRDIIFQTVQLTEEEPKLDVHIMSLPTEIDKRPVILMMGKLEENQPPEWSGNLLKEGYMLVAYLAQYPPDPDPAKRPQWLFFDQRFAHSYVQGASRAINDTARVIDYLTSRGDVNRDKIGWMGSSSTGIPGFGVVTQGPRLAAIVAFVSTGAYRHWFQTWHTNDLWRGESDELWPETEALLNEVDPILHADNLYPTAVLMVSGGADIIVAPATARSFIEAARPYYKDDEERLRLVIYDGFGHNLPRDIISMYIENFFHLYMHPIDEPPKPVREPETLDESVKRTQINAAEHDSVVGIE